MPQLSNFILDTSQAEQITRALRLAPEYAAEELGIATEEALLLLWHLVSELTPKGATNLLRGSLAYEVSGTPAEGLLGTLYSPLNYAAAVELGTKPHWAPIDPLTDWVKAKLGISDPDEARQVARMIQFKIAHRGTEGAHMFERGFEAGEERVREMYGRAVERIVERLGEGT